MTTMWGAPLHKRWRGSRLKDPRQAKFLTAASLKWVLANKAYTPWYLVRYWRLLKFKLANPHIITRGMVFLGKGVEIQATPDLSQMEIGRWVHIGDKNTIRCHEGSLRLGDKVVFGRDNVINTYLDIEFGDSALMADWCYVCDFDHKMDSIELPIKDQGIVKSPVRIGPDTWIAAKVTILRGTIIGRGCVLGAHAVVKGEVPDYSIAVGAPAKVVRNRKLDWETSAAQRAELAANLADIERKKASRYTRRPAMSRGPRSGSGRSTMTPARVRFALTAFGGQVHRSGLLGHGLPGEVGRQPRPGRQGATLRRGGIVEQRAHRGGQPRDVARRVGQAGHAVDHRLAQPARVRGHQRCAGRGGFQRDDAERLVVRRQYRGIGPMEQAQQPVVIARGQRN